ncbi:MAG: hypothetical protein AB1791_13275 [Chloroflexota bacterium]
MAAVCIAPQEIQEGDLLAYAEGAALAAVSAHVAACPHCQAAVADLRLASDVLNNALYRASCPEPAALLRYQNGLLKRTERRRVQRHVERCAFCQVELQQLAKDVLPAPILPTPFEQLKASGRRLLEALALPTPTPALALRGEEKRQVIYQAGPYQVIVTLTPPAAPEQPWTVEGQLITGETPPAGQGHAFLLRDDSLIAQASIDEFGYFALPLVAAGYYVLRLELLLEVIQILDVELGVPPKIQNPKSKIQNAS